MTALPAPPVLYLVTDSRIPGGRSLEDVVEAALAGGVGMVQLRDKGATTETLAEKARSLLRICRGRGVPLIVNDDVEAAALSGADGVHVGQSDADCREARAVLGPDAVIGVSARTTEQARSAEAAGADYLGTGAVFGTSTKSDAESITRDELAAICAAVSIPVFAIGGIDASNIASLARSGAWGAAVVSAVMSADDPGRAASGLVSRMRGWDAR